MAQNLISATLPAPEAAMVQQELTSVKSRMPFLSSLQAQEVNTLFKVGNAYLPFVDQIYQIVQTHPEILPSVFNKEEFFRDYELFKTLSPILSQISELTEGIKKTFTSVGSDTIVESLEVYAAVKQNKDKVPGLSVKCDELAVFFKKAKAKTEETSK